MASRSRSEELIENLSKDNSPIYLKDCIVCAYLHVCGISKEKSLSAPYIDHDYYRGLADVESNGQAMYFRREAKKLQRFEKIFCLLDAVRAISPA